jgi:hypothetical protein
MSPKSPAELSGPDKKRTAFIEGKENLFETRLLCLTPERDKGKNVLIFSRDPGSAQALIPVVKELVKRENISINVVSDGRAKELFERSFSNALDVTPADTTLGLSSFPTPDLMLTDTSASERGLEMQGIALFPDVPLVLVEDYYATASPYLRRLHENRATLPKPRRICVMDEAAKKIIEERFPDIGGRIVVTGQPAFDRFAQEQVETIRTSTRERLGLTKEDTLITYMGVASGIKEEMIKTMEQIKKGGGNSYFIFRRHPRDNTTDAEYRKCIEDAGVRTLDVAGDLTTDQISAASDLIMTNWSTEGIHAAYRRIPTLYVNDADVRQPPNEIPYPLPQVTLGAGKAVYKLDELGDALGQLLSSTEEKETMLSNMEAHYKTDGKNALRVLEVIDELIG